MVLICIDDEANCNVDSGVNSRVIAGDNATIEATTTFGNKVDVLGIVAEIEEHEVSRPKSHQA